MCNQKEISSPSLLSPRHPGSLSRGNSCCLWLLCPTPYESPVCKFLHLVFSPGLELLLVHCTAFWTFMWDKRKIRQTTKHPGAQVSTAPLTNLWEHNRCYSPFEIVWSICHSLNYFMSLPGPKSSCWNEWSPFCHNTVFVRISIPFLSHLS